MKVAALVRSAALVSAVALLPATTAGLAQVDGRTGPEFAKLFAVYQRVKASYVEPVDDDKLIRGAIDGMLASLDPHSNYLDARDFAVAGRMLQLLGQTQVRLLTNNPAKVAGLEAAGIVVAERVPHHLPPNLHNERYLATKRDRTGHQF